MQRKIRLDGVDDSDSNEEDNKEKDAKNEDATVAHAPVEDGTVNDAKVKDATENSDPDEEAKDKEAQKTLTTSKSDTVIARTSNRGRPVGSSSKKGCSPPLNCIF